MCQCTHLQIRQPLYPLAVRLKSVLACVSEPTSSNAFVCARVRVLHIPTHVCVLCVCRNQAASIPPSPQAPIQPGSTPVETTSASGARFLAYTMEVMMRCVCVCMCICLRKRVCVCVCVSVCARLLAYTMDVMMLCVFACVCVCMRFLAYTMEVMMQCVCLHVYMPVYVCVCVCVRFLAYTMDVMMQCVQCVFACVYACVSVYVCVCVCVCMCVHAPSLTPWT